MKNLRHERLSGEFQKEISEIISTSLKYKNPDLKGIISVTGVDVAPDLKNAKVYISVYDKDASVCSASCQIIKDNAPFIRGELAKVMRLRTVPVLHVIADDSMEYGDKINTLLNKIKNDN